MADRPHQALAYLDANVLLRYVRNDDPAQSLQAKHIFAAAARGERRLIVLAIVLAEVVWTLQSFYKVERKRIAATLGALVQAPGLLVPDREIVQRAFDLYGLHRIDFADALIAATALLTGPPVVCTFDRDFRRIAGLTIADLDTGGRDPSRQAAQ